VCSFASTPITTPPSRTNRSAAACPISLAAALTTQTLPESLVTVTTALRTAEVSPTRLRREAAAWTAGAEVTAGAACLGAAVIVDRYLLLEEVAVHGNSDARPGG
jgi:hypothetical protein